jgi:glutamate dehydrogenase (NADP+)
MAQNDLHERLHDVYEEVTRRNAGEIEFHQAVYEVLTSLGPVVDKHPE